MAGGNLNKHQLYLSFHRQGHQYDENPSLLRSFMKPYTQKFSLRHQVEKYQQETLKNSSFFSKLQFQAHMKTSTDYLEIFQQQLPRATIWQNSLLLTEAHFVKNTCTNPINTTLP